MNAKIEWINKGDGLAAYVGDTRATWAPQPGSQEAFLTCPVFECLYEGTRGPGKTDALLMDFAQHVGQGYGSEWKGILFRQSYKQLDDVVNKSKKWFRQIWPAAKFNESNYVWAWPTGERLSLRYIQRKDDYWNYHGHAYPWIGFEELTAWADPSCYKVMMSCCRSSTPGMPRKYRATTNPYGVGHNWVKARFKLPLTKNRVVGPIIQEYDKNGSPKPKRVAIRGTLAENKILLEADPDYLMRIAEAARNESELEAWVNGSWDVTAGGMFDDLWDADVHILPNFMPPHDWRIDRSFDWGSSAPFSVGWWAESNGNDLYIPGYGTISTVRGDLFRINEWYGWNGNAEQPEGLKMLATEITEGIIERELEWGIHGRVKRGPADASIFDEENGNCIADDMAKPVRINKKRYKGVRWLAADKSAGSRKQGWEAMRKRFKHSKKKDGNPREFPGLFVCESCDQFKRTVPSIPRDDKKLDDVNTDAEDHIADEVRYRVRNKVRKTGVRHDAALH